MKKINMFAKVKRFLYLSITKKEAETLGDGGLSFILSFPNTFNDPNPGQFPNFKPDP